MGYNWNSQSSIMRITADGSIASGPTSFAYDDTWDAVWEPNVSTITLNKNGGAGGPDEIYLRFDDGHFSRSDCSEASRITSVEVPRRAGYTFMGYNWNSQSSIMRITADGSIASGPTSFAYDDTWDAVWEPNVYKVNLDDGPGSGGSGAIYQKYGDGWYADEATTALIASVAVPRQPGYQFGGYYYEAPNGTRTTRIDSSGKIVSNNNAFLAEVTLHAIWEANFSAITLNDNGGAGGSGTVYVRWGDAWYSDAAGTKEITSVKVPTRPGYAFDGYTWNGQSTRRIDKDGNITTGTLSFTAPVTLDAQWVELTALFVAGEGGSLELRKGGEVVDEGLDSYAAGWDAGTLTEANHAFAGWWHTDEDGSRHNYAVYPKKPGCAMTGWQMVGPDGETSIIDASSGRPSIVVGATYTALWAPVIAADVPLEVTVRVDLFGVEEQVPASGYLESRSGGALEVAQMDFAPLEGAAELFGASVADVALEALAGEGATAADVSFPLGAPATEADPARLAAFALSDGFGTRVPIGYRFAIPDDALAAIDAARFDGATTPVCRVAYTVALATAP